MIVYLNTNGAQRLQFVQSYDSGHSGTSYFNEYTGKVTHITDDIAFGGNFPGVDIKHVNDTSFKGVQNGFGKGWSLNICETVSLVSGNGLAEKYKVRYRDEDGTEIYFVEETAGAELCDEAGRGMTLKLPSGSPNQYIITLKDGTKRFSTLGEVFAKYSIPTARKRRCRCQTTVPFRSPIIRGVRPPLSIREIC